MKTLFFLLVLALASTFSALAQGSGPQLTLTQASVVGTVAATPYGEIHDMYVAADAQGNTCITGTFSGTVSLGATTLTSLGGRDLYIAKRTPGGTYLWAVQGGGVEDEFARAITTDAAGNVYMTGSFASPVATFGSQILTNAWPARSLGDILVVKLSAAGAWQWATRAGGGNTISGEDTGKALAVDAIGDVYVAGTFDSTVAFFGPAGQLQTYDMNWTNTDIFVGKLSGSSGAWIWVEQAGNENDDDVASLVMDAAGSFYLASYFGGAAQYGPITTPATENGLLISKLNASGIWQWVNWTRRSRSLRYASLPYVSGQPALDNRGSLYIAGYFYADSMMFGRTALTNTGATSPSFPSASYRTSNAFVAKLNTATGAWRWAAQSAGDGMEALSNPLLDNQGNVYVGGSFSPPSFQWGPTVGVFGTTILASAGGADAVIARLDTAGRWQGAWRAGTSSSESAAGYGFDAQGRLLLVGTFTGASTTVGGIALTGNAGARGTLFLGQAGVLSLPTATKPAVAVARLTVYPNPARGSVMVSGPAPAQAVEVLDMLGRHVVKAQMPGTGPLQLTLPTGLAAGVYVVRSVGQAVRLQVE